jgi:hypothetical protein
MFFYVYGLLGALQKSHTVPRIININALPNITFNAEICLQCLYVFHNFTKTFPENAYTRNLNRYVLNTLLPGASDLATVPDLTED